MRHRFRTLGVPVLATLAGVAACTQETASPIEPADFSSRFRCGTTEVEVGFLDQRTRMRIDGETIDLIQVRAASGARYEAAEDPQTFFWSKGDTALVGYGGEQLPECSAVAPASEAPLSARGNEPGWSLELDGDRAVVNLDHGTRTIESRVTQRQVVGETTVVRLADEAIAISITPHLCADDMSGMPHPFGVSIEMPNRTLYGCGGEPRTLLTGPAWRVESIEGAAVPDASPVSIELTGDGQIAGSGGCNHYTGSYSLTGEGLFISPLASTDTDCPERAQQLEQHLFSFLKAVIRFEIDPGGALILVTAEDRRLVARR